MDAEELLELDVNAVGVTNGGGVTVRLLDAEGSVDVLFVGNWVRLLVTESEALSEYVNETKYEIEPLGT